MTSPTKILWAFGLFVLAGETALAAAPAAAVPVPAVSVALQADDQKKLTHSPSEPLLFTLSAADPVARNTSTANQVSERQLDRLKNSGDYQKLSSEELKVVTAQLEFKPPAGCVVGQTGHPAADSFSLVMTNSQGKTVAVQARPLAVSAVTPGPVLLDAAHGLVLFFGIDPDALSKLPDGTYVIEAVMQVFDAKGGLLPRVHSAPISVTLKKDWKEPSAQEDLMSAYRHGRYYLLDHQFAKIEPYVQKMLAIDPNFIGAYELRGDMLYGQGKLPESRDSYLKALNLSATQSRGDPNAESPVYLLSKLNEVVVKLRK